MSKYGKSIKFGPCNECNKHHHCKQENHSDKDDKNCKGCICDQLKRLRTGTEVDVFLSGGQILEDVVFVSFNQKNCCTIFSDPTTEPGSTLIVDCQDIQAIRIEAE